MSERIVEHDERGLAQIRAIVSPVYLPSEGVCAMANDRPDKHKTGPARNEAARSEEPLTAEIVVVEEASMIQSNESTSDLASVLRYEGLFAFDRLLLRYRPSLHAEHVLAFTADGLTATNTADLPPETLRDVPNLTLRALTNEHERVSSDAGPDSIASAASVVSMVERNSAARVLRVLYRIANDAPYFRQPLIEVDMNKLLDDLGYERGKDGYHDSKTRAHVRDVLHALACVELRTEIYDRATDMRDISVAPLIVLRGGRHRHEETRDISLAELLEKGLPVSLRIQLGWYNGVRRPDGQMGNDYALLPRELAFYQGLPSADQLGTADRLAEFLWLRYSRQQGRVRDIIVTLAEALAKSGVRTKNTTRAREIIAQALQHLISRGLVERHTTLPRARGGSFVVTLLIPSANVDAPATPMEIDNQDAAGDQRPPHASSSPIQESTWNAGNTDMPQPGANTDASPDMQLVRDTVVNETPQRFVRDVIVIGGVQRVARHDWQMIYDIAQQRLSPAQMSHLHSLRPAWLVDPAFEDRSMECPTLYLAVMPGLEMRLRGELPSLEAIADGIWHGELKLKLGLRLPTVRSKP